MPELAYINGTFCPIHEAKVSIEDRGFQFGDAVYEVIAVYDGLPFLLDEHLERLKRSAAAIGLKYDFADQPLRPIVEAGLKQSGVNDALVYIQLTRGAAPRSHDIPDHLTPTIVMTFRDAPPISDELRITGLKLKTLPEIRWARCAIKAVTLLPNILAKQEATQAGCDDAIFVTADGDVRECTSSNIYAVTDGRILTPPLTESILHGITQQFLLACAQAIEVELVQERLTVEKLQQADEVFVSNTRFGILGVTSIDQVSIANSSVGPITQRLFEEYTRRRVELAANQTSIL